MMTELSGKGSSVGLGRVGAGRDVPSLSGPVGVNKLARLAQKLVGVRTEVVTLGLDEVGGNVLRPEDRIRSRLRAICSVIPGKKTVPVTCSRRRRQEQS